MGFLSLILIVGGIVVLVWQYFRNEQLFRVLMANSVVQGSLGVFKKMGIAIIAIILGLVLVVLYLKVGSAVRRHEREKRIAQREREKQDEETRRLLQKEAEEARAEAEQARKEAELAKINFTKTGEEEGQE